MRNSRSLIIILAVITTRAILATSCMGQDYKKGDEVIALRDLPLKVETETVGTVRKGDKLTVEDVKDNWLWVRSGETRGWIDSRNVTNSAASPAPAQEKDSSVLQTRLEGQRVAIYNLVGNVEVVQGSGPDVVVEMRRGGQNANRLRSKVSDINGRKTLCVMYPGNRIVDPRGRVRGITNFSSAGINIGPGMNMSGGMIMLDVREDGTFGGSGGQPVAITNSGPGLQAYLDLTVRVPPGRDVAIHVGLGKLSARDAEANLTLHNLVGDVEVSGMKRTPTITAETGSVFVNGQLRKPE